MAVVNNKENRVPWYGYNGGDLAVSHRDYYDMVDPLLDERLSPRMQMKFKNLYEVNSNGMFAVAIVATPIALALTRLYVGPVYRGLGNKRSFWTALSFFWPFTCYGLSHVPLKRKLYTDILTDPTLDGEYIRKTLRGKKPGLWTKLSKQLFEKGYQFPEMNEYRKATEFPRQFVSSRVV